MHYARFEATMRSCILYSRIHTHVKDDRLEILIKKILLSFFGATWNLNHNLLMDHYWGTLKQSYIGLPAITSIRVIWRMELIEKWT